MGWFLGTYVRVRSEQAQAAGQRAEWLERHQDVRAREAVADERARMARELHDIVRHALNIIVIQAAGAQRVVESKPQVARDSLTSIESAGREALSDMERMLGVLRTAEVSHQTVGPPPDLEQVDHLAAQVLYRSTGGSHPRENASGPAGEYRVVRLSDRPGGPDKLAKALRWFVRKGDNTVPSEQPGS